MIILSFYLNTSSVFLFMYEDFENEIDRLQQDKQINK